MKNETTFKDRVIEVVRGIKRGDVLSYKQVARLAGSIRAHRAVGNIIDLLIKGFRYEILIFQNENLIERGGLPSAASRRVIASLQLKD